MGVEIYFYYLKYYFIYVSVKICLIHVAENL